MANKKLTKAEIKAKEQQELIDTLKFIPCTYKIHLGGYGGERVMGTVSREIYDYFKANKLSISDYAWDYDYAEAKEIPEDMQPFPPGSWYECDGLAHANGVALDSGTIEITDENGDSVYEKELNQVTDDDIMLDCVNEAYVRHQENQVVFYGTSVEKGSFFEADIELKMAFDPAKLTLHFEDIDGEEVVHGVSYDGVELDNYGGSTDGKSSDFIFVVVDGEGEEVERYTEPVSDYVSYWPEDWEQTKTFKFNKKNRPPLPGDYKCSWSPGFGTSYGSLEWTGDKWIEYEYDLPKEVTTVKDWSGLNWDTSDMNNKPKRKPRKPRTEVYPYPSQAVLKAQEA